MHRSAVSQLSRAFSKTIDVEIVSLRPFSQGCAVTGKTRILIVPERVNPQLQVTPSLSSEGTEDVNFTIDETFLAPTANFSASSVHYLDITLKAQLSRSNWPQDLNESYDILVPSDTLGRLGMFDHGWVSDYDCDNAGSSRALTTRIRRC